MKHLSLRIAAVGTIATLAIAGGIGAGSRSAVAQTMSTPTTMNSGAPGTQQPSTGGSAGSNPGTALPPSTPIPQISPTSGPMLQGTTQYTGVDLLAQAGGFETLTKAIKAAGLVDALRGPGPFTILAPTDAAFARLPAGRLAELLKPENKAVLARILQYHVIAQAGNSDMVRDQVTVPSMAGDSLTLKRTATGVLTVNSANVIQRDVQVSNGTIQVIDTVLIPNRRSPADAPKNAGT